MKAENMMDAIGRLDEQLLAESLSAKRRNFRPLVVVAAVAAALAVTAGAVNWFSSWQTNESHMFSENEWTQYFGSFATEEVEQEVRESYWEHDMNEKYVVYYEIDDLQPIQLKPEAEKRLLDTISGYKRTCFMESATEMEEFLGLDLMVPDMEEIEKEPLYCNVYGSTHPDHLYIAVEGKFVATGKGESMTVEYCFTTKEGKGGIERRHFTDEEAPPYQEYEIGGLDSIVSISYMQDDMTHILFTHENIAYSMSYSSNGCGSLERVLELLENLN